MSSIIEGYNYDIFISYRQKDNKGDRWVSEFVDSLKTELESTFKEEISVYFDINPHDGLLETHDVDESLNEKLKCLVFIPIISRTYCDPKSFAWEHEFKAFVERALKDQFGLKIKFPNGNVASRVLPVRIYDLDSADNKLCESVLRGVIRGVEFIYKSAGVNRPLTPQDNPDKNLHKTFYRDQINKMANAIKEIIRGMQGEPMEFEGEPKEVITTVEKSIIQEKSIIVLPFENLSPDPNQEYFSDGLTEEIITDLSHIHDLLVISRSSAMTFKGTKKKIGDIVKEVSVRYALEGSVRKAGNNLRITAQLIDGVNDTHIWADKYSGTMDDIFDIQEKVSHSVVEGLRMKLTSGEKETTSNLKAYDLYLLGRYYWNKRTEEGLGLSIKYFEQAISLDENYILAYAGLADAYFICGDWNYLLPPDLAFIKAREFAQKALSLNKNIAEAYATLGALANYFEYNYEKADSLFQTAFGLNPNYATTYQWNADYLARMGRFKESKVLINKAIQLDPLSAIKRFNYGLILYHALEFDEALLQFNETVKIDPLFPNEVIRVILFLTYYMKGQISEAIDEYRKNIDQDLLLKEYDRNVKEIYSNSGIAGLLKFLTEVELKKPKPSSRLLGILYALSGNKEKALEYLEYNFRMSISEIRYLNVEPAYVNLRSEPRFRAIIKKMGLK